MLLFNRDKPPARDPAIADNNSNHNAHNSSAAAAYRRISIPSISSFDQPARRAPLASLDPQAAPHLPLDYLMPSSSPHPANSRSGDDLSKDADRSQEARFAIGRPISVNRTVDEEVVPAIQNVRRKSISNHSSNNSGRSLPHVQTRLTLRRPNTTASAIAAIPTPPSAPRRPSVPSYSSQSLTVPGQSPTLGLSDDLYSGLSSFTFGAVQQSLTPQPTDTADLISPLTRMADSADHTPRPSISGPSGTKPPPKSRNGKQKALADADMGDDEYEDEDDQARQKSRSKMRAIDDGSRRPSLPINVYELPAVSSSAVSPSDPQRQMTPESNSEHEASEADPEEQGELDTDVEFDLQQHSGDSGAEEIVYSDDASEHTFGGGFDHYGFSGGKLLTSDQMSINEDDEDSDARLSVSPVTFTQPGDDETVDSAERQLKRGTLPYTVSGASTSYEDATLSREREDSMATVTIRLASRSMDDNLHILPSTASTITPDQQSMAQFMSFDGHDLPPEPQAEPENDVYDGFKLDYILDDDARRQSISQTSFMERSKNEAYAANEDISPFNWVPGVGGRRPSTVTVGTTAGEDVFTRHVRKNDEKYDVRRHDWSFKKESTDGRGPKNILAPPHDNPINVRKSMMPGTQEMWRQAHIGRFKVDRMNMKTEQPDKAPQQRVNVRHVADPFSKGNTRGGASSVIHKHSRAVAFSIFRTHSLFAPSSSSHTPRRTTTHMNTSISILLATKKVQEQYTSTRTTAKLNSHGLLEDRPLGGEPSATLFSPTATATSVSVRATSRASSAHVRREKSKARPKGKGHAEQDNQSTASGIGSSSHTASGWSHHSSSGASAATSPSPSPAPPSVPSSPAGKHATSHVPNISVSSTSTSETARPSERATSMDTVGHSGSYSFSSVSETMHDQSNSSRSQFSEVAEYTMDLDDEQSMPRTSHAEAFATVDSNYLEYVRGRDQRPTPDHDSHSLVHAFRRRFLGQGAMKARSGPTAGPTSASLEGHFTPPWLTMAPRSKVEERERVIQNLNESFKDVGLLPSYRGQRGHHEKVKRVKTTSSANIFANVPTDCLYMLLPLWPGETDTVAAVHQENPAGYIVPVEERQYLLVYYVPFDERSQKKRDKKRTREEVHKTTPGAQSVNISLQSFRICARLVSYADMRETGVRLPDYGLSITGSMTEATKFLPSSSIRDMSLDDIVIGVCHTRENGMEFVPEGLNKLGLCMPTNEPVRIPTSEEDEPEEIDANLTPIGRAAVEMAWLGSMAVTCFGHV
ncbi:hypothetical protein EUX98_g3415 [Antrodiella citrinella]|uniref:Uncharacterized protein n=1 Tax=Antrodiella citrinella TaxID=2447956 RepID=A0A4S4MWM4_9APHY|nr:hypothetical protein EUX98_g3415 [Antrodiella citrinella]